MSSAAFSRKVPRGDQKALMNLYVIPVNPGELSLLTLSKKAKISLLLIGASKESAWDSVNLGGVQPGGKKSTISLGDPI